MTRIIGGILSSSSAGVGAGCRAKADQRATSNEITSRRREQRLSAVAQDYVAKDGAGALVTWRAP